VRSKDRWRTVSYACSSRRKAIHFATLPVAASLSGVPCVKILLRQTMAQEGFFQDVF
jgi:hypothetical protein